jgi:hypothetical protein
MTTPPAAPEILALHETYCRLTGLHLRMDFGREMVWGRFIAAGFAKADLETVIKYLQRGIARGERNAGALKFHNLVGQLDYFEEDLALARKPVRTRAAAREEAITHLVADGHSVTILETVQPETPVVEARAEGLKQLANLRRQIRGGPAGAAPEPGEPLP